MTEFKNKWLGVSTERIYMLMEIFEEHNSQMKALVGHEFSPLTLERYTTSKKHTHDFMKSKYKVDDIEIKKLNYEFIYNDEFWLKSVRNAITTQRSNTYQTSGRSSTSASRADGLVETHLSVSK